MRELREYSSTVLVAALGALFGSTMLVASGVFAGYLDATGASDLPTVRGLLDVVGYVFLGLALYVSAIVTANTCSTVIAGRTRQIALLRLIGASGATLRGQVTRTGLMVGAVGAVLGTLVAVAAGLIAVAVFRANGTFPAGEYPVVSVTLLIPAAAVVLTTWAAFFAGSRRILTVRPLEALSSTVEARREDLGGSRVRSAIALVLVVVGLAVLIGGVLLGESTGYAVIVTMLGGFAMFTGVTIGASLFVPPVLALLGRIGARNPAVLLSGRNALRAPGRTSRATIGLAIGITLLTTFSVALATYREQVVPAFFIPPDPQSQELADRVFATIETVSTILTGFSAVIAAVGVVNALALGVLQRRREIGLLRAIGFTGAQVRAMIVFEAAQMVVAALGIGLVLGTLFGWAGTMSLFAATIDATVLPVLPPLTILLVVVGGFLVAVLASLGPVRRVTRIAPTEALAVE